MYLCSYRGLRGAIASHRHRLATSMPKGLDFRASSEQTFILKYSVIVMASSPGLSKFFSVSLGRAYIYIRRLCLFPPTHKNLFLLGTSEYPFAVSYLTRLAT